jgi:hypothetical protein
MRPREASQLGDSGILTKASGSKGHQREGTDPEHAAPADLAQQQDGQQRGHPAAEGTPE